MKKRVTSGTAVGKERGHGALEEEEEGLEDEQEEAKTVKPAKGPCAPTKAKRDAHEATHLPFRSWCA